MKKQADTDFRVTFAKMDPKAVIGREELAILLNRSVGAVSLMAHRDRLPQRAFPAERKACWFVGDVRKWLDTMAAARPPSPVTTKETERVAPTGDVVGASPVVSRKGRPRAGHEGSTAGLAR